MLLGYLAKNYISQTQRPTLCVDKPVQIKRCTFNEPRPKTQNHPIVQDTSPSHRRVMEPDKKENYTRFTVRLAS